MGDLPGEKSQIHEIIAPLKNRMPENTMKRKRRNIYTNHQVFGLKMLVSGVPKIYGSKDYWIQLLVPPVDGGYVLLV